MSCSSYQKIVCGTIPSAAVPRRMSRAPTVRMNAPDQRHGWNRVNAGETDEEMVKIAGTVPSPKMNMIQAPPRGEPAKAARDAAA